MNIEKLKDLGLRVYNNKMETETVDGVTVYTDEREIKELCEKTFGHGSLSPERLHAFNEIVIRTAEVIVEPRLEAILGLFCEYKTAEIGDTVIYELPKDNKAKVLWTALGSGVDLVRLTPDKTRKYAQPTAHAFGSYYEATSFTRNAVEAFRNAVDKIADAMVDLYFNKLMELIDSSVTSGLIPAANCLAGSNLSLSDYKKVENVMVRLGGKPVFVADSALINHFADQVPVVQKELLTDELKRSLREDLQLTKVSKSVAVNLVNPYIDEANSKVKFDVETGYIFAGAYAGQKPFAITKFGAVRQESAFDIETDRVVVKIVMESDITLLNGRYIGKISDDSISLA